jgi:hypothetical protein
MKGETKMLSLQFIIYNLTYLAVIAHFLDSAKDHECYGIDLAYVSK